MNEKYTIDQLENIVRLAMEIEGLCLLGIDRDEVSDHLNSLIGQKINKMQSFIIGNSHLINKPKMNGEVKEADEITKSVQFEENGLAEGPIALNVSPALPAVETTNDKIKSPISLNDRFRFERDLFGGNSRDMQDAIDVTDKMDSVSEIKEYLYNDLCFDANSEVVNDFLRMITSRF